MGKQAESLNKETFDLVKEFWEFCMEIKIHVFALYIKSKRNKIADFESRKIRENLEWSIHDHIFSHITNYFYCSFTIDLFASRANKKVMWCQTQLELMPFHLVGNVNFSMHSHLSQ